jgi:hypothetical protein
MLVCAELPEPDRPTYADRGNPDYVELFSYADLDSLMELHGHIRAENPASDVFFRTAPQVRPDDLSGHVVLIGGVAWNDVTSRLIAQLDLPVEQVDGGSSGPDIFVTRGPGRGAEFGPRMARTAHGDELAEDVGVLARAPNPLNSSRTLTICNGVHTRGVLGAVRSLTDATLRAQNAEYLASRFADAPAFGLLMRVIVLRGQAFTPDLSVAHTRLLEWPDPQS